MSLLAWIATAIFVGVPWAGLLYVLVYEPIRHWLRYRNEKPVLASPLLTHGRMTRRQAQAAKARAGYIEVPQGHHRIGMDPRGGWLQ